MNNIESVEETKIETLYLGIVENGRTKDRWCELIKIDGNLMEVLIDTGAPLDMFPTNVLLKNCPNIKINGTNKRLMGPAGEKLVVNECLSNVYIADDVKKCFTVFRDKWKSTNHKSN